MITIISVGKGWPRVFWNRIEVGSFERYYFIGVTKPNYAVPMVVELLYQWWA